MPPQETKSNEFYSEEREKLEKVVSPPTQSIKQEFDYAGFIQLGYCHLAGLYGLYLCFTSAKWATIIFEFILFLAGQLGVTAGVHRLWSHKAYKAKLPLQIILMVFHSISLQYTAFSWVLHHRLHHKFCDTDGDPYNAARGFFYSHIGWVLFDEHPEVKRNAKFVDMRDVYANPVLMFQKKYAIPVLAMACFILPTVIPIYLWYETFSNAWHLSMLRFIVNLHSTLLINSAAHMWGNKPYDKNIYPTQNKLVSFVSLGEGFHNYHHVFPWDYKAAELGNNKLNLATKFIDFFSWIGWAYDLKTVSDDIIQARSNRTGDGTDSWGNNVIHSKAEYNTK